uniref:Uncharacterized protein n=1 Tax=Glossina palpalis gambiensis TaxID=67801 RepID=A0A1B0C353_9MUSC
MMVISRNFENNVANGSSCVAHLAFFEKSRKSYEKSYGRILHEVSPEKVVSPSSHWYQLSSTSHTNNDRNSLIFDVTSSNDYRFAVVYKSPANSDRSSSSSCVRSASARGLLQEWLNWICHA